MKKIAAIFILAALVAGCKNNKNTEKKAVKPAAAKTGAVKAENKKAVKAKTEKQAPASTEADIPDELKAKYEDLAVRIECMKRTIKAPKLLHESMAKAFAASGIKESEYNSVVPKLKLKDSDFVERLASKVSACVRRTIPPKPIDATGGYMSKFVTDGQNSTLTFNVEKSKATARLLIGKKLYRLKGTVTDKGIVSLEYKSGKDSIVIRGRITHDSSQMSGMLRARLDGKDVTARLSALKMEKQ